MLAEEVAITDGRGNVVYLVQEASLMLVFRVLTSLFVCHLSSYLQHKDQVTFFIYIGMLTSVSVFSTIEPPQ